MLVHDSWCSVGVTLATLVGVTAGGGWRYEGREGSSRPTAYRGHGIQPGPPAPGLPWFAANVARKLSIVVRRSDDPWPY